MFDDLKKDMQLLGNALEIRLTPQWGEPRRVCEFSRGAGEWAFDYLAPSAEGQCGALLRLTRDGKMRFEATLLRPEVELGEWRDALAAVLCDEDRNDAGWWLWLYLRVRGRGIECCRLVTVERHAIGLGSVDADRYYLARLSGWRERCVLIVYTHTFDSGNGGTVRSASVRLLPEECRRMAEGLQRLGAAG